MPFDPGCRRCPRLAAHLDDVRAAYPGYHARPVAPFGDPAPWLLIVGLAPGLHGANRTGRPFTGDYAGILLYRTLHRCGLGSLANATEPDDGLVLRGCRITNAVKCLPPENKPDTSEIKNCNIYLQDELKTLSSLRAVLALGTIAHRAVLTAVGLRANAFAFAHGAAHPLPRAVTLYDSYHCSRYNTNTGRLTEAMFEAVVGRIVAQHKT